MPTVASITNPNLLIQEKVNYFSDYFHHFTFHIGRYKEFEMENPREEYYGR